MKIRVMLLIVSFAWLSLAQDMVPPLSVPWKRIIVDAAVWPRSVVLAPSAGNHIWLAINWKSTARNARVNKWTIHEVANDGSISQIADKSQAFGSAFPSNISSPLTDIEEISAIAGSSNGSLTMIGLGRNYRPQIINLSRNGQIISSADLESQIENQVDSTNSVQTVSTPWYPSALFVEGILPVPGGNTLIFGSIKKEVANIDNINNEDGWMMMVDEDCKRIWAREYDFGTNEAIGSATLLDNGEIIVSLALGKEPRLDIMGGASQICILKCTYTGDIINKISMPGRKATVLNLKGGNIAALYDKAQGFDIDTWIEVRNTELAILSEKRIENARQQTTSSGIVPTLTKFNAARLESGDILTTGWLLKDVRESEKIWDFAMMINRYNENGDECGHLEYDPGFPLRPVQIASVHNWACLSWITGIADPDTPEKDRQEVNIIRVDMRDGGEDKN